MNATFSDKIVLSLPQLRSVARRVARDRVLADDLVQETVLRALIHADQFRPGTNLQAWLATILRNSYINGKRSEKRQAQFAASFASESTMTRGGQEGHLELLEFERAFATLTATQREAVALVGAKGHSYEEAARLAGCGVGTMKSRTSRARVQLRRLLDGSETQPEPMMRFERPHAVPTLPSAHASAANRSSASKAAPDATGMLSMITSRAA